MLLITSFSFSLLLVSSVSAEFIKLKCDDQNALTAEGTFWADQFQNSEMEGIVNAKLMNALFCELSKKQRMLETIFGTASEENFLAVPPSMTNEYECLKRRRNLIRAKDPALSQLINGLFAAEIRAKRNLQLGTNDFSMVKKLKQNVAFALTFLANRHQIRLSEIDGKEHFVLAKNNLRNLFEESLGFLNDTKNCGQNSGNCANDLKNWRKGRANDDHSDNKRKRFFQFALKAIKIDWNGAALFSGKKDEKRQRRRKRFNTSNLIIFAILFLFLLIMISLISILCQNALIFARNIRDFEQNAANASIVGLSESQKNKLYSDAFNEIPSVVVGTQKLSEEELLDCAICLGPIGSGTKVRPLPICKHMFHNDCIEMWIHGGQHNSCPICREEILTMEMLSTTNDQPEEIAHSNGQTQSDVIIEINEEVVDEGEAERNEQQQTDANNRNDSQTEIDRV